MIDFAQIVQNSTILQLVGQSADELGLEAYIIGGFVRDQLLGRKGNRDIDIVCVGSGILLAQHIKDKLGEDVPLSVYKNFGTAALTIGDLQVEFVGARKESYRQNSRNPIVEDGTMADDQNRRDFTINAFAVSLNRDTIGILLDPFDGRKDLTNRIIRTPLDPRTTFSDDPLRMLRAIRFASQLGFDIEHDTFVAIGEMVDRLEIISQERITDELNKIILSDTPSYGFKFLFETGILSKIFPEMAQLQGVIIKNGKGHKDNFYHTLQVLDNVARESDNLWLRWSAILHDIAKPATQRFHEKAGWTFHGHEDMGARWVPRIFKRLRLPLNEKMKYVQKLVRLHLRPIALVKDEVTDSAVRRLMFEAGEEIDDLMLLCKADITSKNHDKVRKYLANFQKVEMRIREVEEKDQLRNFENPITGEVIISTFEIEPSRMVGDIKEEIKEAILEGVITNEYEPAFHFMKVIGEKKGLVLRSK